MKNSDFLSFSFVVKTMFGHRCSFFAFIIVMSCLIFMDDAAPISAVGWANLPTDAPISEDTIVRELNPPTGKNDLSEFWKNLEQQERNREERRKKQQEDNDQFQRNFAESVSVFY